VWLVVAGSIVALAGIGRVLGNDNVSEDVAVPSQGQTHLGVPSEDLLTIPGSDAGSFQTELADTYGVTPTTVADFISEFIAASAATAREGA